MEGKGLQGPFAPTPLLLPPLLLLHPHPPTQKLAEGAAVAAAGGGQQAAQGGAAGGVSTWNAAGTFEERDVTEWAKQRLPEMLVGLRNGSVTVTSCKSITGHANIWCVESGHHLVRVCACVCVWVPSRQPGMSAFACLRACLLACRFIRKQKRAGFDFENLELCWQHTSSSSSGSADADGPRGTVKLLSVAPDDIDDLHLEVSLDSSSSSGSDEGAAALRDARALKQPLQEALTHFLAELRDK